MSILGLAQRLHMSLNKGQKTGWVKLEDFLFLTYSFSDISIALCIVYCAKWFVLSVEVSIVCWYSSVS